MCLLEKQCNFNSYQSRELQVNFLRAEYSSARYQRTAIRLWCYLCEAASLREMEIQCTAAVLERQQYKCTTSKIWENVNRLVVDFYFDL